MARNSINPSSNTRKLVLAAIFAALDVFLSSFAIPVVGAKVFPFQQALNADQ